MLSAVRLPFEEDGSWWTICSITGSLIRHKAKPLSQFDAVPSIVKEALLICDQPYKCKWTHEQSPESSKLSLKNTNKINKLHDRLLKIGNSNFFLLRLYASFSQNMFDTTYQAMGAISQVPEQLLNREERCLQRSLLAAKLSKSFLRSGVLFIGATTTNADMHAWIIEDGSQPDHEDRGWINYRPLLALINK
jgi:hypothetical protein